MKINEVINEKERVDEVLPAIIGGAVRAAPYVWKGVKHVLPYLKKLKGIGTKAHMAGEIGKKIVKKSPPTPDDGSELAKAPVGYGTGQVDPALASAAKKRHPIASPKLPVASPRPRGKMSPEAGAAIAQAQQAQRKRQRP
jgi:hypothetical protein